jgi:predicted Zn-dependent peptidase
VLFDSFANTHDGYGSFVDLESATLDDAQQFFDRYYAPGNAVLTVVGDVTTEQVREWADRHFADIPGGRTPKRPSFAEKAIKGERRGTVTDRLAPAPALALAWRTTDSADLAAYLPYVVLAEVLTDGDAARLQDRLLLRDRSVTSVGGYLGVLGDSYDERDPTPLIVEVHHPEETSAESVIGAIDEEIDRLASDGLDDTELARTVARMTARYLRELDPVMGRAQQLSVFEQQRDRAELVNELPGLLEQVTAAAVQKAATTLRQDNRAVLELRPETSS